MKKMRRPERLWEMVRCADRNRCVVPGQGPAEVLEGLLSHQAAGSSPGLLGREHFQIAYATNDIEQACARFGDWFGITEFRRLEGSLPQGGQIRVQLARAGGVMFELLTASGAGSAVYMDRLPKTDRFALRHHHLGYLVENAAAWDVLLLEAGRNGFAVPHDRTTPGFMRTCFVDATPLGHYLEFILPEAAGIEFFRSVPAN